MFKKADERLCSKKNMLKRLKKKYVIKDFYI